MIEDFDAAIWLILADLLLQAVFLVLFVHRSWLLAGKSIKASTARHGRIKFVLTWLLAGLRLLRLLTLTSLVPSAVSFLTALSLIVLSRREHERTVRSSTLIILYLLLSLLHDALGASLALILPGDFPPRPMSAVIAAKCALLFFECRAKALVSPYSDLSPEEKSNVLGRATFWWINPILARGYRKTLQISDLPPMDSKTSSKGLREHACDIREESTQKSLAIDVFRCIWKPFTLAAIPRLLLVLFRYGQPVLISQAIRFVTDSEDRENAALEGYFIILMAVTVYVGVAVATAAYRNSLSRLQVMIRGILTSLIHDQTLKLASGSYDDGKTVGLITTDVSALETGAEMFHETWALALEVIVGILFLANQVGYLWPLPFVLIFLGSRLSRFVAQNMKTRQAAWNKATEKRLASTSSMLGSIKNIKMLGLEDSIQERILALRQQEIAAARSVRWVMFMYNANANAIGMFTPCLTITLFAVLAETRGEKFNAETAFTTIALLAMITHPANMITTFVLRVVGAYPSYDKVKQYLNRVPSHDGRTFQDEGSDSPAISLDAVSLEWPNGKKALQEVTIHCAKGEVCICSGPVAAGKTTLARVLVGEQLPTVGNVSLSGERVAYCAQTPWLPNKSIDEVIRGPAETELTTDALWYEEVIRACCLEEDFKSLSAGDKAQVGSKGMNLSGGQRQRVALARAIYQRSDIVILDDPFSALDRTTRGKVVENLFGTQGLFKKLKTTVFWISNSTEYFRLADEIIVLANGIVVEQGPWNKLSVSEQAQFSKIIHPATQGDAKDDETSDQSPEEKLLVPQQKSKAAVDDINRKTGDLSLYSYYFRAAGVGNVIFLLVSTASCGFSVTFPQYWLKWWTESPVDRNTFYICGFVFLYFMSWVWTNTLYWIRLMRIAQRSGELLHERLLGVIMSAPLVFFSRTDTSVTLNRFSQDIQLVDKQLAEALSQLIVQICKLAAQIAVLYAVERLMTLTLPLCIVVVYVVQKVYLRTSRQLRILEIESRAAVYSSFLETVQGIETIRAFGWQSANVEENIRVLDDSQRPFYLLLCLQRWLNIVLNLLVAAIAVGVICVAVALRGTTTGGQVGVALNVILVANTTLLSLVETWTNLEISLGAVSRLKEVIEGTPQEELSAVTSSPEGSWPTDGAVEFKDVTAAYNPTAVAFRDLRLEIEPGQTAVICGRTGSGKSSMLLSLLRMIDVQDGSIIVDGQNLSHIPHRVVRERGFITVSQDPFILPDATLRYNLCPSGHVDDLFILSTLDELGLLASLSHHDGQSLPEDVLDKPMSALPALSGGQAQLVAVARGILRNTALRQEPDRDSPLYGTFHGTQLKPPVLLDEVTSSLDAATEQKLYETLHKEFIEKGHTVIMVTHKLDHFESWLRKGKDMVVWMEDGKISRVDRL